MTPLGQIQNLPYRILAVSAVATSLHFSTSTVNQSAQAAIDQGLFLYYAYNRRASYESFERAATDDPHLAIAYWGMALASGPDLNTPMTAERFAEGARAISKAEKIHANVSVVEQRFISIMALRYRGTFQQWNGDDAAYRDAMVQFAAASGNETAKLLAAEASLESGGLNWEGRRPASPQSREALALVTGVLQTDPSSAMANHLCVHLYDLAPIRAPALPCAQRLDATTFPPQAEHLAHMPAHYWIETGNYSAAESSSERAVALTNAMDAQSAAHDEARYRKHDVSVGYSAAMMLGNYADARRWADRMAGVFDTSFYALTALRFARYAEAYQSAASGFGAAAVKGLAALQLGRTQEAETIAQNITRQKRVVAENGIAELFLARAAEAKGSFDEARKLLARTESNQRTQLGGELIPLVPAGEAFGALELRHANARRAIDAFTQTLREYPNDPRALFGLAQAYAAENKPAQAAAARAKFLVEWKGADTNVQDALP